MIGLGEGKRIQPDTFFFSENRHVFILYFKLATAQVEGKWSWYDTVDYIEQSDIRLYADDTLVCVNLSKHPNILQAEVDKISYIKELYVMMIGQKPVGNAVQPI